MPDFNFTATAECERCGQYLSSSDDDCDACADEELRRYHFVELGESRSVETVFAINPVRAWVELHDCVDNVLPYRLHETGAMSLDYAQMGYDVTDKDELRTPNRNS